MTSFFLVLSYASTIGIVFALCLFLTLNGFVISNADLPTPWQMLFQDPLTLAMEGIVDLHHDICFFLITILILVLWLGARIVYRFHHTRMPVPERFNHHTSLELIWAILPSLVVTMILLPSLTLIYTFDDLILKPRLTVKVVGLQWYWRYAMDEHVHYNLVNVDRLLEV
uniref:Cytochrome c oxidase polypeptide II n=1 Tax=Neochloris aquatica TaxID=3099 RepID=A0A076VKJ9_9CHLO|nr:cytochrome c oxidase subunit 2a [Neochloris aquatica]AIK29161.1 cytochrome c oxidase subunit 2a [Neochloris aquatica]